MFLPFLTPGGSCGSHQFGWAGRARNLFNEILKALVLRNQLLNTTLSNDHRLCRWRSGRPNASRPGDGPCCQAECPTSEAITWRAIAVPASEIGGCRANESIAFFVLQCTTSATSGGSRPSVTGDSQIPTWRRAVPTRAKLSWPHRLKNCRGRCGEPSGGACSRTDGQRTQGVEGNQVGCLDS